LQDRMEKVLTFPHISLGRFWITLFIAVKYLMDAEKMKKWQGQEDNYHIVKQDSFMLSNGIHEPIVDLGFMGKGAR